MQDKKAKLLKLLEKIYIPLKVRFLTTKYFSPSAIFEHYASHFALLLCFCACSRARLSASLCQCNSEISDKPKTFAIRVLRFKPFEFIGKE